MNDFERASTYPWDPWLMEEERQRFIELGHEKDRIILKRKRMEDWICALVLGKRKTLMKPASRHAKSLGPDKLYRVVDPFKTNYPYSHKPSINWEKGLILVSLEQVKADGSSYARPRYVGKYSLSLLKGVDEGDV